MHAATQPVSRTRLTLYAALCHLALLAHQALYYRFTEGAASSLFDWARTLAQTPEAAFQPAGSLLLGLAGALAHLAGLDVETGVKVVTILAAHGLLAGLLLVTRPDSTARPFWTRLLAPGLLAVAAMPAVLSTNGLEPALFSLLVFVAFVRFAAKEMRFSAEVAIWFVLATAARPEGAVYAAIAVLSHLAGGRPGELRSWVGPLLFGAVAGALFGTGLVDAKGLLPSSSWSGFLSDWDFTRLSALVQDPWGFFSLYLVVLALPMAVSLAVMWEWPLVRASALPIAATLLWAAWTEPDSRPELLLFMPALPFCLLLAQEGYSWLLNRILDVSAAGRSRATVIMLLLPCLLAVAYSAHSSGLYARMAGLASMPVQDEAHPGEEEVPGEGVQPAEGSPADQDVPPDAAGPAQENGQTPEPSEALEHSP